MRYRRDVPRDDQAALDAETGHVRAHLSACTTPDDDPDARSDEVHIEILDHVDGDPGLVSVIGEIDAEPVAPYLQDDFDPDAGEPVEFVPYEEPDLDRRHDPQALAAWRAEQ